LLSNIGDHIQTGAIPELGLIAILCNSKIILGVIYKHWFFKLDEQYKELDLAV
jgi:hypothetical protein